MTYKRKMDVFASSFTASPFGNAVVTCYVTSELNDEFSSILEQTRDAARRDCIPTQSAWERETNCF